MSLPVFARRFVLLCALGLWLGGFAVYTGIVIRIGHRHFPDRQFGFVTGEVTAILDMLSAAAIVFAGVNVALDWKRLSRGFRWAVALTGVAMLLTLAGSVGIHSKLDALLDYPARHIRDRALFEPLHERYELFASLQWGFGVLFMGIALAAWGKLDGGGVGPAASGRVVPTPRTPPTEGNPISSVR
jgi:hypothetical protein